MLSAVPSRILVESESTGSSSVVTRASSNDETSNPKSQEKFSNFGDDSCGEPLFAQHVIIDFTPDEAIDNDFVQKKICSFWKFIHNTPEIQNLIVLPDRHTYTELPSKADSVSEANDSESKSDYDQVIEAGRTAVSMMEFVHEKGLIDRTFEAKMPQSKCTLGSREYKENDPISQLAKKKPCTCKTICTPCPGLMKKPVPVDDTSAKKLCRTMKAWDAKHPKSMEPPSHPPPLQHAVLQRSIHK